MLSKVKNLFFRCQRFLKTYYLLIKHVVSLQLRQTKAADKVAIIYLMRKRIYFQMALICISSFLYYNKNFKIVVYCDKKLNNLCNSFKYIFRNQNIEIRREILDDSDPMLEQVRMFMRTGNGNTILMDADIRWTGPLVYNFVNPLVYNREENVGHIRAWDRIKDFLNIRGINEFQVFTCCLTSLGGHSIQSSHQDLEQILSNFLTFHWQETTDLQERFHIRGQLLISHIISELGNIPDTIVKIEKELDQKILETSFYGATGYRYGL
jgi:hypothetical protein